MSLYEFLLEAELTFYHNVLQSQLKVWLSSIKAFSEVIDREF